MTGPISCSPAQVEQHLREIGQARARGHVLDDWGFADLTAMGGGLTALFAGPSGCGKTMAAQVLARSLGLELYRVDLAGVVSKYIGETEKQLRMIFDACERAPVLLLFDEADALFGKRTQVRDAHDRFANIEIDYLLQLHGAVRRDGDPRHQPQGGSGRGFRPAAAVHRRLRPARPGGAERLWRLALAAADRRQRRAAHRTIWTGRRSARNWTCPARASSPPPSRPRSWPGPTGHARSACATCSRPPPRAGEAGKSCSARTGRGMTTPGATGGRSRGIRIGPAGSGGAGDAEIGRLALRQRRGEDAARSLGRLVALGLADRWSGRRAGAGSTSCGSADRRARGQPDDWPGGRRRRGGQPVTASRAAERSRRGGGRMSGLAAQGRPGGVMPTIRSSQPNVIAFQFNPEKMAHTWTQPRPRPIPDGNRQPAGGRGHAGETF